MKALGPTLLAVPVLQSGAVEPPDPLVRGDGSRITTAAEWREKRRPEVREFFTREIYGHSPGRPEKLSFEVFDRDKSALDGKATRKLFRRGVGEDIARLNTVFPTGSRGASANSTARTGSRPSTSTLSWRWPRRDRSTSPARSMISTPALKASSPRPRRLSRCAGS